MYRRTFEDASLKNYRTIDLRSDTLVRTQNNGKIIRTISASNIFDSSESIFRQDFSHLIECKLNFNEFIKCSRPFRLNR